MMDILVKIYEKLRNIAIVSLFILISIYISIILYIHC